MPSELSIFPKLNLISCLTEDLLSTLPETADMGETLAARFAGDCAAKNTVTTPIGTAVLHQFNAQCYLVNVSQGGEFFCELRCNSKKIDFDSKYGLYKTKMKFWDILREFIARQINGFTSVS